MGEDQKAAVLDHIVRPMPPWRPVTAAITECGKPAAEVKQAITPGAYRLRIEKWGQRRTAFTVCQTCASRAGYSRPWEVDPVGVIQRETERVRDGSTYAAPAGQPGSERARFTAELRAIAALIAAHRGEYDACLAGLAATDDLAAHRARRRSAR